jgi:hypothetical protein
MESLTLKNQVSFTHQNVLECVAMFHKHKMKKMMNSSLARVLHQMIQTSQIYPVAGWVVLFHNVGMNDQQLEFLWKCMVVAHLVDLHDNAQICFEHSSLGSKIRKTTMDELYNNLYIENVKINCSCSLLKMPSALDGTQHDFHSNFMPLHANNAHDF